MIFVYNDIDYNRSLQNLADRFGGTFDGVTMHFSPEVADGYMRIIELPSGLKVLHSDYLMKQEFTFFRTTSTPEVFTFRVDYIDNSDGMQLNMGEDKFTVSSNVYTNVMMFSTRYNAKAVLQKGTRVLGISIILKQEWLEKYFPKKLLSFWLNHTHILRSNNVNIIPLDFEARKSLFDLLNLPCESPAFLFFAQTRLLELFDYYFEQVSSKVKDWKNTDAMLHDVGKITELDIFFTKKILEQSNMPSIEKMALKANMSESKLKTIFKKIYNQSIGDYFASCRLDMASNLLLKDKMSIKEITVKLGFNSVQHFTTAFKKHYGHSPASLFKSETL
jgi:AraC-like DNA-binding protein